ncbi:LLM class flavin-dependent oxidoreductase [Streptomyces bikiniensis]|uniref:LLM class flavin-dependent oxidoreductase n=1 Tax=Streptomyces bikiniensis TaxID=1896 RepID=UPI0009987437|nr:LLM class flavin-dependent oxidoreductase [Streptomyces bikiniensis]
MKFGVDLPDYGPEATPDALADRALRVEAMGYDYAMVSDHVALTPDVQHLFPAPFYDPFATLAWLAGITRTVGLGTTVAILPYRHPVHTARVAANIDRFSDGRLLADLAEETWIFATTGMCHDIGVAACTEAGFTPQASHAIGDWDATLAAVRLGLGVALVPRLAEPAPRPEVTVRAFSERAPSRTVFAAVREGSQTSPEIAAVLDALRTVARAAVTA